MKSKLIQGKAEPIALFRRDGSARTAGAITKAKGGYAIADTSTTAKKGDIYRAETATTALMVGKEYKVIDASTNSFTIASKDLPTVGDTFYILGKTSPRLDSTGAGLASIDTITTVTTVAAVTKITADVSATSTITNPTPLATTFTVQAANANRKGLRVTNDTNGTLRLAFAATATTTAYTVPIYAGGYYNMEKPIYTGLISGICDSAPTGTVASTEST